MLSKIADNQFLLFCSLRAASINPRNRGCGRLGRDLNSGCACVPINHGCSFNSTISTILPSGDIPESIMPFSVRTFLKSLLTSYLWRCLSWISFSPYRAYAFEFSSRIQGYDPSLTEHPKSIIHSWSGMRWMTG